VEFCFFGMLDLVKVVGKIVFCKRGINVCIDKSLVV